jgi:hypothetical protein
MQRMRPPPVAQPRGAGLALERRVPAVLDGVVGAAGQQLGDDRPLVAIDLVGLARGAGRRGARGGGDGARRARRRPPVRGPSAAAAACRRRHDFFKRARARTLRITASSYSLNGAFLTAGLRWLCHLGRAGAQQRGAAASASARRDRRGARCGRGAGRRARAPHHPPTPPGAPPPVCGGNPAPAPTSGGSSCRCGRGCALRRSTSAQGRAVPPGASAARPVGRCARTVRVGRALRRGRGAGRDHARVKPRMRRAAAKAHLLGQPGALLELLAGKHGAGGGSGGALRGRG